MVSGASTDHDAALSSKGLVKSRCCQDDTGLFSCCRAVFMLASCIVPTLNPRGYRTPRICPSQQGSMERLAQTSDIDKAESQSPCSEAHGKTVVCIHRYCLNGSICQSWHSLHMHPKFKISRLRWTAGWQARTLETPKCMKTLCPSQKSRAKRVGLALTQATDNTTSEETPCLNIQNCFHWLICVSDLSQMTSLLHYFISWNMHDVQ